MKTYIIIDRKYNVIIEKERRKKERKRVRSTSLYYEKTEKVHKP